MMHDVHMSISCLVVELGGGCMRTIGVAAEGQEKDAAMVDE
jgi:hypothetical protein